MASPTGRTSSLASPGRGLSDFFGEGQNHRGEHIGLSSPHRTQFSHHDPRHLKRREPPREKGEGSPRARRKKRSKRVKDRKRIMEVESVSPRVRIPFPYGDPLVFPYCRYNTTPEGILLIRFTLISD